MTPVNMLDNGTVIERTDACLGVRFFWFAVQNETQSGQRGRPVFDQVEMIEITTPGSKDKLHRRVNDFDKMRFQDRYWDFVRLQNGEMPGTPLNQFPFISVAELRELEYFNVYTGEQLVSMPDGNIDKLGVNGRDLIKKVSAYMKAAQDTSVVTRMTQENEDLKREMNLMKKQMDMLLKMKEEGALDEDVKKAKKVGSGDKDWSSLQKGKRNDGENG